MSDDARMMVFAFPDERAELWEEPGSKLHKLAGADNKWLYSPSKYRCEGGDGQPGYEYTFEVWDGVPVCTEVKLTAKPAERVHVRAKDLKAVAGRIEDDLHRLLPYLVWERNPHGRGFVRRSGDWRRPDTRKAVESARGTTRRKMAQPGFLQSVADTYKAASGPGVEAVATVFEVQTRQAWRYIEKARKGGFLDA